MNPFPNITIQKFNNDTICLYNNSIWFQLGKHTFYYAKISYCIFIFYGNELFFVSNKKYCSYLIDFGYSTQNLSLCLNQSNKDFNYKDFIENEKVKEYNQSETQITIDKYVEEGNIYFHLMTNYTIKNRNISSLYSHENNEKIDLLLFKADIKRKDTISTQVEYQFYQLNPSKIYEKVDIYDYLKNKNKKRRLQNNNENNDNNIYIDLPISWQGDKLNKINELYGNGIDPFNSSADFYLEVCTKYKTSDGNDIYLQNRKDEYYPDEAFCEDNCEFVKYNRDTGTIQCKCPPKKTTENYEKINFKYNEKDEKFKKKYTSPNLKVITCNVKETLKNNAGFFITFIILILFFLLFLYRIFKGNEKIKEQLDEFKKEIALKNERNLKEMPSDPPDDNNSLKKVLILILMGLKEI